MSNNQPVKKPDVFESADDRKIRLFKEKEERDRIRFEKRVEDQRKVIMYTDFAVVMFLIVSVGMVLYFKT